MCVCVCVCEREREMGGGGEKGRDGESWRGGGGKMTAPQVCLDFDSGPYEINVVHLKLWTNLRKLTAASNRCLK